MAAMAATARRARLAYSALALLLLSAGSQVCSAMQYKEIDPTDPAVVKVTSFFEGELDAKFNGTVHKVAHFSDAQRQVVNGFNYLLTVVVKATTAVDENEDWVLHKVRVYEHPAWDTSAKQKYELSLDDVPVYQSGPDVHMWPEAVLYAEEQLGGEYTGEVRHSEQVVEVDLYDLEAGHSTVMVKNHRVYGKFVLEGTERFVDFTFVTKGDGQDGESSPFTYFDKDVQDPVPHGGGGSGGEGGKDVKLLTMRTSMIAIFLVGLVVCGILLVHVFRKRHKRSKEDWYIEQLTDIDEL